MQISTRFALSGVLLLLVVAGCEKLLPPAPDPASVMDAPLDGLTPAQFNLFNRGAEAFDAVFTPENGLGPVFVATSCGSCHSADNRGHLFTLLTRFGQSDAGGNHFLALGGPQLQNRAIPGHVPESLPLGAPSSGFIAPIVSGTGFLELVSDADLLAISDPDDADGDGISGVPQWNTVPDFVTIRPGSVSQNGKYICRFGRKAAAYDLLQQTATAYNQDMGITSSFFPENPVNYLEGLNGLTDSEVDNATIGANVFYLQTLQTPFQRNANDPQVQRGEQIFKQIGCESCHRQTLKTGDSPVAALAFQTFHPYTDLLLHDMGPGLDDGYTEGSALSAEWRTTPLWGLGLAPSAQGGQYFLLHDGRARSIEAAIQLHGGEAAASATAFGQLAADDKNDLILFLKSL